MFKNLRIMFIFPEKYELCEFSSKIGRIGRIEWENGARWTSWKRTPSVYNHEFCCTKMLFFHREFLTGEAIFLRQDEHSSSVKFSWYTLEKWLKLAWRSCVRETMAMHSSFTSTVCRKEISQTGFKLISVGAPSNNWKSITIEVWFHCSGSIFP